MEITLSTMSRIKLRAGVGCISNTTHDLDEWLKAEQKSRRSLIKRKKKSVNKLSEEFWLFSTGSS